MVQRGLTVVSMAVACLIAAEISGIAQAGRPFTTAFPKEEFTARRLKVAEAIGADAVALMQAAPTVHSSAIFRQSNEFFYLTGVGVPQAMLLIDGATKKTSLYLPMPDAARAAVEGALLSPDDAPAASRPHRDRRGEAGRDAADGPAGEIQGWATHALRAIPAGGRQRRESRRRDPSQQRRRRRSLGRPHRARGPLTRAPDHAGQ